MSTLGGRSFLCCLGAGVWHMLPGGIPAVWGFLGRQAGARQSRPPPEPPFPAIHSLSSATVRRSGFPSLPARPGVGSPSAGPAPPRLSLTFSLVVLVAGMPLASSASMCPPAAVPASRSARRSLESPHLHCSSPALVKWHPPKRDPGSAIIRSSTSKRLSPY